MRRYLALFMAILGMLACACVFGANMVLTPADLGDQYPDLFLNSAKSGPQTRDQVINAACDPAKQASEMDASRWVAEYINEYDNASGGSSDPTFLILSQADLFQDAGGAVAMFKYAADTLASTSTECEGVDAGRGQLFDFPPIGDESVGANVDFTARRGGRTVSGVFTFVMARKGNALVSETVARYGSVGRQDEAVRLTKLIVDRMN